MLLLLMVSQPQVNMDEPIVTIKKRETGEIVPPLAPNPAAGGEGLLANMPFLGFFELTPSDYSDPHTSTQLSRVVTMVKDMYGSQSVGDVLLTLRNLEQVMGKGQSYGSGSRLTRIHNYLKIMRSSHSPEERAKQLQSYAPSNPS